MKKLKDFKVGDRASYIHGEIIFKSPMEHNVRFLYGDPYVFITQDRLNKESELYYFWELDTKVENREYVLTEILEDYSILRDKGLAINNAIREKLYPSRDYSRRLRRIRTKDEEL